MIFSRTSSLRVPLTLCITSERVGGSVRKYGAKTETDRSQKSTQSKNRRASFSENWRSWLAWSSGLLTSGPPMYVPSGKG